MRATRLQKWVGHSVVAGVLLLVPAIAWAQAAQPAPAPPQPAPAPTQPTQSDRPAPPPPADPEQEARMLTIGNTVQVVYHLVAQDLIDQLALQRPGDATDNAYQLASVLVIAASDDPAQDPLLLAGMRGLWRAVGRAERTNARLPFWAERGLDRRRATSIVCTFYASEPDEYRALADEIGLTDEQRRACADDFARLISAWGPPIRPHISDTSDTRPGRGTARASWSALEGYNLGEAVRPLRESGVIERIAHDLTAGLRLARDLTIRLEPCNGRIAAEWDRQRQTVLVCYELVEAFGQLMAAEVRDRPPR